MRDWDDLRLFLAVARVGGLAPAARDTGRSPATLGRRMAALERTTGRALFRRHGRGYDLTEDGRRMVGELAGVEARLRRLSVPEGNGPPLVTASAGTWTARALLAALPRLLGDPPDLRLRFVSTEARLDLARREAQIGFRNARPEGAGLAGRRIDRVAFAPFARPGAPHLWIRVLGTAPSARWLADLPAPEVAVEVAAPRNALDLALAGAGRALLPTFAGDAEVGLRRAGPEVEALAHDRWLVLHEEDRHRPEVRRAADRMVAALAGAGA